MLAAAVSAPALLPLARADPLPEEEADDDLASMIRQCLLNKRMIDDMQALSLTPQTHLPHGH